MAMPEQKIAIEVISNTNYWWLLTLAIIPVVLGYWLNRRNTKKGK